MPRKIMSFEFPLSFQDLKPELEECVAKLNKIDKVVELKTDAFVMSSLRSDSFQKKRQEEEGVPDSRG